MKRKLVKLIIGLLIGLMLIWAVQELNKTQETISNQWVGVGDTVAKLKAPVINAKQVALIDQESGRVIYAKNANVKTPMASTTKIMTAIVALDKCKLDEKVTVSEKAANQWGSDINLNKGEVLTIKDLLYGLLVKSGNDAAVAIAEHCGGSVEGFAKLMNRKAASIGALNSSFANPHGLDAKGHYTTALDLAIITRYAMSNKDFATIVQTQTAYIKDRVLKNTNTLLFNYGGADGVKTGYTGQAGRCLVASASREGRRYIAVALGAPTSSARAQTCANLLNYAFQNYETHMIYGENESVSSLRISKGKEPIISLVGTEGQISVPVTEGEKVELRHHVPIRYNAPVAKGIEVGFLDVYIDGELASRFKLKTNKESERKGIKDFYADILGRLVKHAG